ncbi:MAG: UbiA family prenyltransferase [Terricaulis sp.]
MADSSAPVATAKLPLAVDLDGTLIRNDVFIESMLQLACRKPWKLPQLILWLMRGRAFAKQKLAAAFPPDVDSLPYDPRVLSWLRAEHAHGRTIALATASDRSAAQKVADHLGLFDAVFASDGEVNLKSKRKAEALANAYPKGFVYAGNESADLKVWSAAREAVIVNAAPSLERDATARFAVEKTFAVETNPVRGLIKALRPRQWAKNFLVFVPMLSGQGWAALDAWQSAALAFVALSLSASGIYLINDASDIEADRRHPTKRNRPFASGALSPLIGLPIAFGMIVAGIAVGAVAGVLTPLAVYLVATTLYTFWLKRIVLADVFLLAGLYTWRIVIGGVATSFVASDWLLAFSSFFFLSLALVKRATEIDAIQGDPHGRGYRAVDGPLLKRVSVGAGLVAALILALYLQQPGNYDRYAQPAWLWALPAAVVFFLCRVWLKLERSEMHDDPVLFALKDRVSWLVLGGAAAAFTLAAIG